MNINPDYLPVFRGMAAAYGALALFGLHPPQVLPLFAPVKDSDLLHGVVLIQGVDRSTDPAAPILMTITCGALPGTDVNIDDDGEGELAMFAHYAATTIVVDLREFYPRPRLVELGIALVKTKFIDQATMDSAIAGVKLTDDDLTPVEVPRG